MNGIVVIDKPSGITSRAAVDRALRWFPKATRVGHTGTLDPLATGVLVLCVGVATRLTEYVQAMDKVYRAGILLGCRSDTDDADGIVTTSEDTGRPNCEDVRRALDGFIGEIEQVPPQFSAAKVTGRRAYQLARRGQEVALEPRRVRIYSIEILRYEFPRMEIEVRCGKGTYIRSLARDLGERLGCGGLIESLRRSRVGCFTEKEATSLEIDKGDVKLLPVEMAVSGLEKVHLSSESIERLRRGQAVDWVDDGLPASLEDSASGVVAVFDREGKLVGIARSEASRLLPERVLVY